jgi:hypothetical protein
MVRRINMELFGQLLMYRQPNAGHSRTVEIEERRPFPPLQKPDFDISDLDELGDVFRCLGHVSLQVTMSFKLELLFE